MSTENCKFSDWTSTRHTEVHGHADRSGHDTIHVGCGPYAGAVDITRDRHGDTLVDPAGRDTVSIPGIPTLGPTLDPHPTVIKPKIKITVPENKT